MRRVERKKAKESAAALMHANQLIMSNYSARITMADCWEELIVKLLELWLVFKCLKKDICVLLNNKLINAKQTKIKSFLEEFV